MVGDDVIALDDGAVGDHRVVVDAGVADRRDAQGLGADDVGAAQVADVRGPLGRRATEPVEGVVEDLRVRLVDADLVGERPVVEQLERARVVEVAAQDRRRRQADVADDADLTSRGMQRAERLDQVRVERRVPVGRRVGQDREQRVGERRRWSRRGWRASPSGRRARRTAVGVPVRDVRVARPASNAAFSVGVVGDVPPLGEQRRHASDARSRHGRVLVDQRVPEVEGDGFDGHRRDASAADAVGAGARRRLRRGDLGADALCRTPTGR